MLKITLALLALPLLAQDWPQFLGPTRNGVYPASLSWPGSGPPVLWKKDVGQGFAAPVVSNGRLILFHRVANKETVDCFDASSGRRLWSFDYSTSYRDDFGFDEGPRAAPAISGNRVYTFGAEGVLHCLDFSTGKKIWSADTHRQFGVRKGFFGAACSPLVEGNAVLLNVGGVNGAGIVAFDKETGKVIRAATNDEASYSAPTVATIAGARHALFFTRAGLVDLDPATGKVRFQFPWRSRGHASVNAATPLVIGDLVFLSASYETGAVALQLTAGQPKKLWSSDDALSNHYATAVYRDGYLYGFHGRQEYGQSLRCIDLKAGKIQWSQDGFGAGTVSLAEDHLLIIRENGELLLAPASPKQFRPLGRAQILPATVRPYPALAGGRLYARNEKTLACLALNGK